MSADRDDIDSVTSAPPTKIQQLKRRFSKETNRRMETRTPVYHPNLVSGFNFPEINKAKVRNNWNGTGKEVRDDLIQFGGSPKFLRTKR